MKELDQRIILEKGKQHLLIEKAKKKMNSNWFNLAREVGVSENYLKSYLRREIRTLKAGFYEKLCKIAEERYDKYIIEVKDKNWGRSKGGKNSPSKPKIPKLLINEPNEDLAEFFGIMFGDGNCYELKKKGEYQVRIVGHKEDEVEYMTKYIPELMEKLFFIKPSIYFGKKTKSIVVSKQSKDLLYTLLHFGLKIGNKKTNGVIVPKWILKNKQYLKRFTRGLIDTDGSVCPKTKNHKTPTIWFSSASPTIRESLDKAFKILGYNVSVWAARKDQDCRQCSIGRSSEVLKYYNEIGFSNSKHIVRFQNFFTVPRSSSPVKS